MKLLYHFSQLIRTLNLLIMALSMVVVQLFFIKYHHIHAGWKAWVNQLWTLEFSLLLISTLLIAAAGYIINDYFDVKADRVNRPERLIIDKYIKRRWAMVWNWSFNAIGILMAFYLGYLLQNIFIPLVAFISINILWFYSAYFKRRPFTGNLIVALLLGVIPIYVLIFQFPLTFNSHHKTYLTISVILISAIAFLTNLVREMVKDLQDIRGDVRLGAKTLPILKGSRFTKTLMALFSVLTLVVMGLFYSFVSTFVLDKNFDTNLIQPIFQGLISLSMISLFVSTLIAIIAKKSNTYKLSSALFKITLAIGMLIPLFL